MLRMYNTHAEPRGAMVLVSMFAHHQRWPNALVMRNGMMKCNVSQFRFSPLQVSIFSPSEFWRHVEKNDGKSHEQNCFQTLEMHSFTGCLSRTWRSGSQIGMAFSWERSKATSASRAASIWDHCSGAWRKPTANDTCCSSSLCLKMSFRILAQECPITYGKAVGKALLDWS